jgi:hypothetical protein
MNIPIAVQTPTEKEFLKLLGYLKDVKKIIWTRDGTHPPWSALHSGIRKEGSMCVKFDDHLGYDRASYYESFGYEIISLEEFFKRESAYIEIVKDVSDLPRRIKIRKT